MPLFVLFYDIYILVDKLFLVVWNFNQLSTLQDEQIMYPYSLGNERFTVALVNCEKQGHRSNDNLMQEIDGVSWEITRAIKCD